MKPSLWNTKITETDGNFPGYSQYLHSRNSFRLKLFQSRTQTLGLRHKSNPRNYSEKIMLKSAHIQIFTKYLEKLLRRALVFAIVTFPTCFINHRNWASKILKNLPILASRNFFEFSVRGRYVRAFPDQKLFFIFWSDSQDFEVYSGHSENFPMSHSDQWKLKCTRICKNRFLGALTLIPYHFEDQVVSHVQLAILTGIFHLLVNRMAGLISSYQFSYQ